MSNLSKVRLTVFPNGLAGFLMDDQAVLKSGTYTVLNADSGSTLYNVDAIDYTLPSISIGRVVTFQNMANDGAVELTIDPAAADGITYAGSSTDGVTLINTLATSKKGDFVILASLDGVVAWQVVAVRGIWAKGA